MYQPGGFGAHRFTLAHGLRNGFQASLHRFHLARITFTEALPGGSKSGLLPCE
jgi:hypothetical protein